MTALDNRLDRHPDTAGADSLDACRARVEPALRAAVGSLPPGVRHIAGYHMGWWEQDGRPVAGRGGKAIRPAFAQLSATAVGGDPAAAVPAAVAVELVHDSSLLHDDVMDQDRTRRHRPTAWAVFGVGPAILAGDALLALAADVLVANGDAEAVRTLNTAVQELLDGQLADLDFERRSDVGMPECLAMAEGKTGALLGTACALGAAAGGGTAHRVRELERVGRDLGLAFQLVDDLIGIWGDPTTTGKPVRNDLRSRKKSLPVVAALMSGTPAGRELGVLYHGDGELSAPELERAAELTEQAGGRAWSHERADTLLCDALDRLDRAAHVTAAADGLRVLAQAMVNRDR